MKSRKESLAALNAAINAYAGDIGPGQWVAQDLVGGGGRSCIGLTYTIDLGKVDGQLPAQNSCFTQDDGPWRLWGGSAILAAAGLGKFDGMVEVRKDKYGDDIYADSAMIEVTD